MDLEQNIILNLYNITPAKSRLYSIFIEGFLIEINKNRIIKWNLKESAQLFNESNKVAITRSNNTDKFKNYAYIPQDKLNEFLHLFGQPSFKALNYFSKLNFKPKLSFRFLYLLLIVYYLALPVMMIAVFFKIAASDKKELMFNYYHTVNIPEELYEKILKNQFSMGLDLQERKDILKKIISKFGESNGPWLDLGCGLNSLLIDAEQDKGAEIFLLDPNAASKNAYESCKDKLKNTKVKFVIGSGEKLPFEDNYFSFIYCGGVIAHVCYLDKFLLECERVLKPGGFLLFDESNECPGKNFINSLFSMKLKKMISSNHKISENYAAGPPKEFISNPWAFWGYSTDHFWVFNLNGLAGYLSKFFKVKSKGGVASYLCNNGNFQGFPLFYSLDLGRVLNLFLDFNNLPKWYLKLMSYIFGDIGIYIYTLCEKNL